MKTLLSIICLICISCAANTLYQAKGAGIYTVLELASIGARLLSMDNVENQEGLLRLSDMSGVDIQAAFNDLACATSTFIATLKELRHVLAQPSSTRSVIDPKFFEEFDKIIEEIPTQPHNSVSPAIAGNPLG